MAHGSRNGGIYDECFRALVLRTGPAAMARGIAPCVPVQPPLEMERSEVLRRLAPPGPPLVTVGVLFPARRLGRLFRGTAARRGNSGGWSLLKKRDV